MRDSIRRKRGTLANVVLHTLSHLPIPLVNPLYVCTRFYHGFECPGQSGSVRLWQDGIETLFLQNSDNASSMYYLVERLFQSISASFGGFAIHLIQDYIQT
jgi:hypothetical protein